VQKGPLTTYSPPTADTANATAIHADDDPSAVIAPKESVVPTMTTSLMDAVSGTDHERCLGQGVKTIHLDLSQSRSCRSILSQGGRAAIQFAAPV
jgi:hypothetical protein